MIINTRTFSVIEKVSLGIVLGRTQALQLSIHSQHQAHHEKEDVQTTLFSCKPHSITNYNAM
jgi:hypothetical protein